jgi:hypothetical protein
MISGASTRLKAGHWTFLGRGIRLSVQANPRQGGCKGIRTVTRTDLGPATQYYYHSAVKVTHELLYGGPVKLFASLCSLPPESCYSFNVLIKVTVNKHRRHRHRHRHPTLAITSRSSAVRHEHLIPKTRCLHFAPASADCNSLSAGLLAGQLSAAARRITPTKKYVAVPRAFSFVLQITNTVIPPWNSRDKSRASVSESATLMIN